MKRMDKVFFLALVASLALAVTAYGTSSIRNSWLAAYPDACAELTAAAQSCALCHEPTDPNPYAQDYWNNGRDWAAIEGLDSDGDGVPNGKEIQDCTLPGDASSLTPTDAATWGSIKSLYR